MVNILEETLFEGMEDGHTNEGFVLRKGRFG
jgi:hypothetical protein